MVLNHDCARDLILWIEKNQTAKSNGVLEKIKMKSVYTAPELSKYTREDMDAAARYLVDGNALRLAQDQRPNAPKWFVFSGITATGYDYITAVRNDTVWKKVKAALGPAVQASIPAVISIAAQILL